MIARKTQCKIENILKKQNAITIRKQSADTLRFLFGYGCAVSHALFIGFRPEISFCVDTPGQPETLGNVQNEQFPRRYSNMAGTLRPYFGRLRTAANVR